MELTIDTPSGIGGKDAADTLSIREDSIPIAPNTNAMTAQKYKTFDDNEGMRNESYNRNQNLKEWKQRKRREFVQ